MAMPKAPAWTAQEVAVLRDLYPAGGVNGVADALPERTWRAIHVMAHRLGIKSTFVNRAPELKLKGHQLDEAVRMREEGMSFGRIGAHFDVCELSATNAVMIALCSRRGHRAAERDANGRLTAEGKERLRLLLRKGLKAVDIQLRLGLSASSVAYERRRYNADLKARGKALLPPPGGGAAYSGRKFDPSKRKEVEQLFMQGLGAMKITERTGVSNSHVGRIRNRMIKRLARRGECLPGCNRRGVRLRQAVSKHFIAPEVWAQFRAGLMLGTPVARLVAEIGISRSAADRNRREFIVELTARGETLPPVKDWRVPGRRKQARRWLPAGMAHRFRVLANEIGTEAAKAQVLDEHAAAVAQQRAAASRPLTFEEQLERVRNGARLAQVLIIKPAIADVTLGGIATGML